MTEYPTTAWQLQSLSLCYPDARLVEAIPLLRAASGVLPDAIARPLGVFADQVETTPLIELASSYVATFDHRRKFSPYLTYFAYGDTRKRGMALLRFKHAYRAVGMELNDDELPDHLAVVLEFAASGDAAAGRRLLLEHRAGLELMRLGLRECDSPWANVLESVTATLPPLNTHDHSTIARLAAEGPPEEEVGLAPYGPPEYMPTGAAR
ncbi:nitrate reductase molybdenum cofactor assembly chaperone [Actinokineospora enzanensis]|uniref:nitrate reductase molybdenum cofactor assembly chaperone n=1 Tax=Actinokineospora enzanensis TaxID=155975 RepID=UPI00037809B2|nr:nitrate reductase molybdenum cofactor assembly chaperone [Actinokineospora enzanensis]